jgi:hypothetical protein
MAKIKKEEDVLTKKTFYNVVVTDREVSDWLQLVADEKGINGRKNVIQQVLKALFTHPKRDDLMNNFLGRDK